MNKPSPILYSRQIVGAHSNAPFLSHRAFDRWIIGLAVLCLSLLIPSVAAQETNQTIRGRVTDYLSHPVSGAHITVREPEKSKSWQTVSDQQGRFEIPHESGDACSLQVDPGPESGLSSAFIDNIPGDTTRQISVHLHQGFLVSGRVTSADKGLKGLTVKVLPSETDDKQKDIVHGGGATTTGANGQFRLVLTPGAKSMLVSNKRYPKLPHQLNYSFSVTGDTRLPDLNLSN